jgi:hypothetical protein
LAATDEAIKTIIAPPKNQVVLSGDNDFHKLNKSCLSILHSELIPAAIFLPRDKDEVAMFVCLLEPFALDGNTQIAIKSAGQHPVPGRSNIEGSDITFALRSFTYIELKYRLELASAGAQCTKSCPSKALG